jgi:arginyl-tRNA synthetase
MSADSVQSKVAEAILKALEIATNSNLLACAVPTKLTLERPKNRDHGDYATSVALSLAKQANLQPRVIAQVIMDTLISNDLLGPAGINKVEIAGPGFINITLETASQAAAVVKIISLGKKFGTGDLLVGKKIHWEESYQLQVRR